MQEAIFWENNNQKDENHTRDVSTGATGATEIFRHLNPIPTRGGQILPTISVVGS